MEKLGNRNLIDRRKQPTPALSRYIFFGRRRTLRRKVDQKKGGYVDRYGSDVFLFLMLILTLNVLDTLFTMIILDAGAWEVNPVVNSAITLWGDNFWIWKFAIVSFSVILLYLHSQFRYVKTAMLGLSVIFITVILYQISTIMHL